MEKLTVDYIFKCRFAMISGMGIMSDVLAGLIIKRAFDGFKLCWKTGCDLWFWL